MMAIATSFMKIPENMYRYKREFPLIFAQLANAARERGLIPFLTEFGGSQETEEVGEYLNLHYEQIKPTFSMQLYGIMIFITQKRVRIIGTLRTFLCWGPIGHPET
jgi:hypothetical protein